MKHFKILGLVVVVTAAVMAFFGASSASATVLCTTTPEPGSPVTTGTKCPANWAEPAGTVVHAVNVGVISIHTTFKTVECKQSTYQFSTDQEGSATETISGAASVLSFTECNCEIFVTSKGTLEVHWIRDSFNGTVTSNGAQINVQCQTIFGKVHCIYVSNIADWGEITGSATHTAAAIHHLDVTFERKATNALCDEEATWTGTYEITSPKPLWIADHT